MIRIEIHEQYILYYAPQAKLNAEFPKLLFARSEALTPKTQLFGPEVRSFISSLRNFTTIVHFEVNFIGLRNNIWRNQMIQRNRRKYTTLYSIFRMGRVILSFVQNRCSR